MMGNSHEVPADLFLDSPAPPAHPGIVTWPLNSDSDPQSTFVTITSVTLTAFYQSTVSQSD
jgi:hypothetical protein